MVTSYFFYFCFLTSCLAYLLLFSLITGMFVVKHHNTKANSFYVKTYLAMKLILNLIEKTDCIGDIK